MNQENQDIFNKWQNEIRSAQDSRNQTNYLIGERQIMVLNQKREWFKILIQLVAGVIITPHLLDISKSKPFYITGVSILLFLVVFIILYLREVIDSDSIGLQKLQDESVSAIEETIAITKKYMHENIFTYHEDGKKSSEIINSEKVRNILKSNDKLETDRKNRDTQILDYTGEFTMFIFLSGVFWILASIFPSYFNWVVLTLGEILLLICTSLNSMQLLSRSYSQIQHFGRNILK